MPDNHSKRTYVYTFQTTITPFFNNFNNTVFFYYSSLITSFHTSRSFTVSTRNKYILTIPLSFNPQHGFIRIDNTFIHKRTCKGTDSTPSTCHRVSIQMFSHFHTSERIFSSKHGNHSKTFATSTLASQVKPIHHLL